ncbi:MAG: monofunctional biosynthetic peptidoglycan transglycosylase [Pseudomonadota bacterium]|jgi:monofunctional biosynthetic peptidoglycan transglycosylase
MARRGGVLRRIGRGLGWLLVAGVAAVLALQLWFLAHVLWYRWNEPGPTAFMRAQLAVLREADPKAAIRHTWVPYARISPHLKRAVIAAEDANFTEHDGVDWEAIERAHERNQKRGKVTHGGSTITMQLAKNLFLSGERSYPRKAQELVIAFMLEAVLSKERILELYLNVAEWGVGVFGAEAAAQRWYRTSADRLGAAQAARLAAMLPRPRFYDRNPGSATLGRRAETIQRWMTSVTPP